MMLFDRKKAAAEAEQGEHVYPSQWKLIWRGFLHHRLGNIGAIIVLLFSFSAMFAQFLGPYNFATQHSKYSFSPPTSIHFFSKDGFSLVPFVYRTTRAVHPKTYTPYYKADKSKKYYLHLFVHGEPYNLFGRIPTDIHLFGFQANDGSHAFCFLFGTDQFGRDIFTRTLVGGRVSLLVGPFVILLSFPLAILLGGLSGYYGGGIDMFLQRAGEVVMAIPGLPILLAVGAALSGMGLPPMMIFFGIIAALAFLGWAGVARVIRGQVLAIREMDFVIAAKAAGANDLRIILRHVIPSVTSYLVVAATLTIPGMMLAEATLSFLGYGIREPMTSWGQLLTVANNIGGIQLHPWLLVPGIFIVVGVLAFNFIGDALRDAVDPFSIT